MARQVFFMNNARNQDLCRITVAWEDLVRAVSKSSEFQSAVFLRLDHITPYASSRVSEQLHHYEDNRLVYRLAPGSMYRLNFSVFENLSSTAPPGKETRLKVLSGAKDILGAGQPFQSLVSGLVEKSTIINCKRTIENIITTLSILVDHEGSSSALVNSPNPTLFVRVSVSRWTLFGFLACVFLGGFSVTVGTDFMKELCVTSHPVAMAAIAKVVGAVLLAAAAFLAFRKLPSGDR
jgi:hypothetical protein